MLSSVQQNCMVEVYLCMQVSERELLPFFQWVAVAHHCAALSMMQNLHRCLILAHEQDVHHCLILWA